jgi:hypothetical protein
MVKNICSSFILLLLSTLICSYSTLFAQELFVELAVNPQKGSIEDSFNMQIIVRSDSQLSQKINRPEIYDSQDFSSKYIGPETRLEVINGAASSSLTYHYKLTPRKEGKLKSPSAKIIIGDQEYELEALNIEVISEAAKSAKSNNDSKAEDLADQRLSLRQEINVKQAYIGQQLAHTLDLYSRYELRDLKFSDSTIDGFWTQKIGDDEQTTKQIGNSVFRVFRRNLALFPLRAGKIEIPSASAELVYFDSAPQSRTPFNDIFRQDPFFSGIFGMQLKRTNLSSNSVALEVNELPRPISTKLETWGAIQPIVGESSLEIKASNEPINFGDSKSVELVLESSGNLNAVNTPPMPEIAGLKIYSEPPKNQAYQSANKLRFRKIYNISLVPQYGGTVTLPPFNLDYFDLESASYKRISSQGLSFEVKGGPKKPEPTSTPSIEQIQTNNLSPAYQELGLWQRIKERFSLELSLLILVSTIIFSIVALFSVRLIKKFKANQALLSATKKAQNAEELSVAARELLSHKLNVNCNNLGTEQIKSLVRKELKDKEQQFVVQSALEQLDQWRFGAVNPSIAQIEKLASDLIRVLS